MPPKRSPSQNDTSDLWRVSGLGMELAGAIVGTALLGWWIDSKIGTSPRWTMILVSVGFIGGGYNFIRRALAVNRSAMEHDRLGHKKKPTREPGEGKPGARSDDERDG